MPTQIPSFMQNTPTAPKKPFPSTPNDSVHPKRSMTRIVLLVVALLAIGGVVAYYFVSISGDGSNSDLIVATSNSNQNENQNINQAVTNNNSNANQISNTNTDSNVNKYVKIVELSDLYTDEQLAELTEEQKVAILEEFQEDFLIDEEYLLNDADTDGVLSSLELMYGTSSDVADTDGDGYDDLTEINGCYNPNGSGRMNIESYYNYCNAIFSPGIEQGITTADMVNDLCTLWDDYVKQEIIIKKNDSQATIWDDIDNQVYIERCEQFNTKYPNIENEDNFITICGSSLMYAANFCNVIEAAMSY